MGLCFWATGLAPSFIKISIKSLHLSSADFQGVFFFLGFVFTFILSIVTVCRVCIDLPEETYLILTCASGRLRSISCCQALEQLPACPKHQCTKKVHEESLLYIDFLVCGSFRFVFHVGLTPASPVSKHLDIIPTPAVPSRG